MLRLVDIRKSYRVGPTTREVLQGIDLEVGAGDLISIMGASGSGKTTLMNLIGLLDRPTSGACFLNERDVSGLADDDLSTLRNAHVGFVFQSFHLLPRLTALENVCLPLVYQGLRRMEMQQRAHAMLTRVGMADWGQQRPGQLSGGQKQRVAIARSLVTEPTLLLADEPTGALDADTAAEVMALLLELNEQQGVTILIITHDPLVARRCKRRLRIHRGTLLETEHRAASVHSGQPTRSGPEATAAPADAQP
ncbi:MAG: ABC transporter ATP-binding protein [Gammaproteobacteria bacterium]|nr:ABC transporter ATP-binding protein [Gammaproteobacteria bacterium]